MSLILCWNTSLPEHNPYESLLYGVLKQQISYGYQIKESLPKTIPTVYTTREFSPNHFTRNLAFMKSKYGDKTKYLSLTLLNVRSWSAQLKVAVAREPEDWSVPPCPRGQLWGILYPLLSRSWLSLWWAQSFILIYNSQQTPVKTHFK